MTLDQIKKLPKRYQPIILPDGKVIKKKCAKSIQDSRKKVGALFNGVDFKDKTYLDIGCAEGFFLREALSRGAKFVKGVDIESIRVNINNSVNRTWNYHEDKIKVIEGDFRLLNEKYDIVSAIAVLHHFQRMEDGVKFLDTWKMITDRRYDFVLKKHLELMKFVSSLANNLVILEYPYTYEWYNTKREDIDFELIGRIWERQGIFAKVEFKGFVQKSKVKDRAVYFAYKNDYGNYEIPKYQYNLDSYSYSRADKGVAFMVNNKSFTKVYNINPTKLSTEERRKRFDNELKTYKYLSDIKWTRSPKLLEFSEEERILKIERFKFRSVHEYLSENKFLNLPWLIKELQKLEKDLIKNKINCLGITNKDILIGDGKLWLVDFEETYVDSPYSQSLPLQLIMDLRKRWNTFYETNKQKRGYKYLLFVWAFRQFLTLNKYNIQRFFVSFSSLLYSYYKSFKLSIINKK